MAIDIRPVQLPADAAAIDQVLREAFEGEDEVALVRRLREDGEVEIELVAATGCETGGETGGEIVGVIVMSRLPTSVDGRDVRALALAPVAVRPAFQSAGTGGLLIRSALTQAWAARYEAIILLGHPEYYPRFGFSAALAAKLDAPFQGPAFMALEVAPGALDGAEGRVAYPEAFQINASH